MKQPLKTKGPTGRKPTTRMTGAERNSPSSAKRKPAPGPKPLSLKVLNERLLNVRRLSEERDGQLGSEIDQATAEAQNARSYTYTKTGELTSQINWLGYGFVLLVVVQVITLFLLFGMR